VVAECCMGCMTQNAHSAGRCRRRARRKRCS
jgi:hypothetical protein